MIKRAIKNQKQVTAFLKKMLKDFNDKYDMVWYALKSLLEGRNYDHMYAVYQGNVICDIITYDFTYGIKTLYPFFFAEKSFTIEQIKKYFKKGVLIYDDWLDGETYGLYAVDLTSSIDSEKEYCIGGNLPFVLVEDDKRILPNVIERKRFPELGRITFRMIINNEEIHNYLQGDGKHGYPMWQESYSSPTISGFHYLQPDFLNDCTYLFVAETKGKPIAAIKWGKYYGNHYGVNYIDVAQPYQRKGIAKELISEFSKYVPSDLPLVLTRESEKGKLCQMEKHFKAADWKTKVYTAREWEDMRF